MQPSRMLLVIGLVASLVIFGSSYSTGTSSNYYLSNDIKKSFATTSNHHNQTSVPGNETRNGTVPSLLNFPNSSDPHGNLTRARRNADPLSEYSHKLSTVARISNGISLLASLINGNIPVDSVIQELLNFGDVKVQDVLALDKTKVDTAMDKLNSADGTLKTTPEVQKLEKEIIGFRNLREAYKGVGDFATYKTPDAYFVEVKKFKDDKTDLGVFKLMSTETASALKEIDNIRTTVMDNVNHGSIATFIRKLGINLKNIGEAAGKLKAVVDAVDKFNGLSNPEETFKTLLEMLEVLSIHRSIDQSPTSARSVFTGNFDTINALTQSLDAGKTDLVKIGSLLSGLSHQSVTKRQYTLAFAKGPSDLKLLARDIRDPSVEQTIGTGKNFARLSGGLKPLETLSSKLDPVETKLRTVTTAAIRQSSKRIMALVSLMTNLQLSSNEFTTAHGDIVSSNLVKVDAGLSSSVDTLIENSHKLKVMLSLMKSLAQDLPAPPIEVADVERILNTLPDASGKSDVSQLLSTLKTESAKMERVEEYLNGIKPKLENPPDGTTAKQLASNIESGKQGLIDFLAEPNVKTATTGLNALSKITSPLEKIAKGAQACQIIRDFKKDDITNIKSAVETISQASGLIKEIQNVPNTMKTNKPAEVKELVAMKKSKETATTLGFAAGSVRSMDGLRGLAASVTALKNDQLFDAEVKKLTDPKKSEILQKYGDHKAFVTALEASISQINTFKSNLAVPKDLKKLGAPLTDAKSVPSVPESIQEKSDALEMLIWEVTDPQTKTDLGTLKDHMDQLGALDLNFASGHTAFSQVPAALQGLFTFLSDFLTPKPVAGAGAAGTNGSNSSDSAGFNMLILVYIGAALLVLVVIGVIAYFVYVHNRDKKKPWNVIHDCWLSPALFKQHEGYGFASGCFNQIKSTNPPARICGKPDPAKMRRNSELWIKKTGVKTSNGFIYANWVKNTGSPRFIATQGPLDGKERRYDWKTEDGKQVRKDVGSAGKDDTREDFLMMCVENQVEFVVQLCQTMESQMEFPGYQVQKSAPYWAACEKMETFGRYNVTTLAEEEILEGEGLKRNLCVLDTKTNKKHEMTQLHWMKWPDHGYPKSIDNGVELMEMVNKSKKPIVVHCSMGMGRTCSFIAIETLACEAERHPKRHPKEHASEMRFQRAGAFQSTMQFYYAFVASIQLLVKRHGAKLDDPDDKKTKVYNYHLKQYNQTAIEADAVENIDGVNFKVEYRNELKKDEARKEEKKQKMKSKETSKTKSEEAKSGEKSRQKDNN